MSSKIYIYVLKDPITDEVRYVGQTHKLNMRYTNHISESKRHPDTPKTKWIYGLLQNNQKPIMEVLEVCDISNLDEKEKYWIDCYRSKEKSPLTNLAVGGADNRPLKFKGRDIAPFIVGATIEESKYELLKSVAEKEGISVSAKFRYILDRYLDEELSIEETEKIVKNLE